MPASLRQYLAPITDLTDQVALYNLLRPLVDSLSCQVTTGAGLVIKTGGSTLAKTGSAVFQGIVKGKSVKKAAATDMPALVGSITAASFNVFCFFIDQSETVTVAMGVEGTTEVKVTFPPFPENKLLLGYLVVTHSSTFVGGTTALDTATTKFVSPMGALNPSILI